MGPGGCEEGSEARSMTGRDPCHDAYMASNASNRLGSNRGDLWEASSGSHGPTKHPRGVWDVGKGAARRRRDGDDEDDNDVEQRTTPLWNARGEGRRDQRVEETDAG